MFYCSYFLWEVTKRESYSPWLSAFCFSSDRKPANNKENEVYAQQKITHQVQDAFHAVAFSAKRYNTSYQLINEGVNLTASEMLMAAVIKYS